MRYLLDTDWVIDDLKGVPAAAALIRSLVTDGIAISVVSLTELYEGVFGSRDPRAAERTLRRFLSAVSVLLYDRRVAVRAARIRADLRAAKRQVNHRVLDIAIAATAIEHGLILVTRKTRHYLDIPGLTLYRQERDVSASSAAAFARSRLRGALAHAPHRCARTCLSRSLGAGGARAAEPRRRAHCRATASGRSAAGAR